MMKRSLVILVALGLAGAAPAANNFGTDPNVKAVYRFENGALTTDSSGQGNTLTASGSSPTADTVNFREGAASADFNKPSVQYFSRTDADLSTGFPGKNGTTFRQLTVCGWIKLRSASGGVYQDLVNKWDGTGNRRSWALVLNNKTLELLIGYNGGASAYIIPATTSLVVGEWFHIAASIDDTYKQVQIVLYRLSDASTMVKLGGYATNLNVEDAPFTIGADSGTAPFDGLLDEVVIFDRVLYPQEISKIRAGVYTGPLNWNNSPDDPNCAGQWRFEAGALGTDSSANANDLTVTNAVADGQRCEGLTSALFAAANSRMTRADANLSTKFPCKNGTTNTSFTICFWLNYTVNAAENILGKGTTTGNNESFRVTVAWVSSTYARVWVETTTDGTTARSGTPSWGQEGDLRNKWVHIDVLVNSAVNPATWRIRQYDPISDTLLDSTSSFTGISQPWVGAGDFWLGSLSAGSLTGSLDELMIFNRLLSDAELDQIQEGTFGGGPVGWW